MQVSLVECERMLGKHRVQLIIQACRPAPRNCCTARRASPSEMAFASAVVAMARRFLRAEVGEPAPDSANRDGVAGDNGRTAS